MLWPTQSFQFTYRESAHRTEIRPKLEAISYPLAARGKGFKRYRPHIGMDLGAPPESISVAETVAGAVDSILFMKWLWD